MKSFKKFYEKYDCAQVWEPELMKNVTKYFKEPILDVGCFKGEKPKFYFDLGFTRISGCDISKNKVKEAKKKYPKIDFFCNDFENKGTTKKFNTIYSYEVIEHVFDFEKFLKNINSSLEVDGNFILTTPNVAGIINRLRLFLGDGWGIMGKVDHSHIRFFTKEILEHYLKKHGFEIIEFKGYNVRKVIKNIPMPTTFKDGFFVIAKKTKEVK
jgi:2-polyprenyl-3-methyl-5-hydroxy-6-metoxy-1,4-benzoquinol methylase